MNDYLDILQYVTVLLNWLPGGDYLLTAAKWAIGLLWLLWGFFLAVMALWRARREGTLSKPAMVLGIPYMLGGYALDIVGNIIMTIPMLELPHEWFVTTRLKRHKYAQNFRGRIARWMAAHLLDPFDPRGTHV